MSAGPFLPAGPFRLVPGYVRKSLWLGWTMRGVGLLFVALIASVGYVEWATLQRDSEIWRDPDAVEVPADFEGRYESTFGLLSEYRGDVQFRDVDGGEHRGRIEFTTLVELDTDRMRSVVRYRRGEPDAFVYSWAGEGIPGRWWFLGLMVPLFALVLGPVMWLAGSRFLRGARVAAAVAEDGEECVVPLLDVREQRQYGRVVARHVIVELAGSDGPRKFTEMFGRRQGAPCRVADDRVLALVSPRLPGSAVILRHDLYPLELSPLDAESALARIHAAFPPAVDD